MNTLIKIILFFNLVLANHQPTFEEFCVIHNKQCDFAAKGESSRKLIYETNVKLINTHNSNSLNTYSLEINEWADLTWEEFKTQKLSIIPIDYINNKVTDRPTNLPNKLPTQVDWRSLNRVGPIKNQGNCGSCWAFSSVAALESALAIYRNTTIQYVPDLSEQQLVDCSKDNSGCNGGLMTRAYVYIAKNGLVNESSYPYIAQNQVCKSTDKTSSIYIRGYAKILPTELALMRAVSQRVISVGIEVDPLFRFYKSGVYNRNTCRNRLNHAVNIVGYTPEYWIVRNSWGGEWGEQGYIRIARNKNICGINLLASYPVL